MTTRDTTAVHVNIKIYSSRSIPSGYHVILRAILPSTVLENTIGARAATRHHCKHHKGPCTMFIPTDASTRRCPTSKKREREGTGKAPTRKTSICSAHQLTGHPQKISTLTLLTRIQVMASVGSSLFLLQEVSFTFLFLFLLLLKVAALPSSTSHHYQLTGWPRFARILFSVGD